MRVRLANHHRSGGRIDFSTQIAGDDARRDARGTHQEGERAGVVFAETALGLEQEIVDGVHPDLRGRQRVAV